MDNQFIGSFFKLVNRLLTWEKGREPKKPYSALKGEGWALIRL